MKKALIILLLLPNLLFASYQSWSINKDHTEVMFKLPYLGISEITGSFGRTRGNIFFEKDFSIISSIEILIHSESIYTGNKIRDGHLKGADFFNAKKYPFIKFVSKKIKPEPDGSFIADGELSLLGKEYPFIINFSISELVNDTWGNPNRFVKFNATLDRNEVGLRWNKTLANNDVLVGDIASIWGTVQIQPRHSMTPSSHHMIPDSEQIRKRELHARGEIDSDEIKKFDIDEYNIAMEEAKLQNEKKYKENIEAATVDEAVIPQSEVVDNRGLMWWLAYCTMGMIGFLAMIFLCIEGKILFFRYGKKKYEEVGFYGFLSDMAVTPILLLYVWAMWQIGYGV